MNAIIALCHFCEAHGPCPILCTHTLRDTKIDELVNNNSGNENACPGCNSIGKTVGLLSQDSESNANFLTTQTAVISDIVPLVKQAAVRSLSCEVCIRFEFALKFLISSHSIAGQQQQRWQFGVFRRRLPRPCPQLYISNPRLASARILPIILNYCCDER